MKTGNNQYAVWYDGDVEVNHNFIEQYLTIVPSQHLCIDEMTDAIKQYNQMLPKINRVRTKTELRPLDFTWNIPPEYSNIDLKDYLVRKLDEDGIDDPVQIMKRINRIIHELQAYESLMLSDVLHCLIFVVDTFIKHNIVWGIGRGSSVSSYVLYLIGVHDIDSVLFNLPFTDFIKA